MTKKTRRRLILPIIILTVLFFVALYKIYVAPPAAFPQKRYDLTVTEGESSSDISKQLAVDHVVKSRKVFQFFMVMLGSDTHISEGDYYFKKPISSLGIALQISGKNFGINRTYVTVPEGYTDQQISARLTMEFPRFNITEFNKLIAGKQGYLFPDTYKFFPTPQPQEVVTALENNYEQKVAPLRSAIAVSGHTEAQIIVMASIIQKEAEGPNDSPVIAGILWKRIADNIPLQVDAVPATYHSQGLPDAPIDNPGLVAIQAAITPIPSPYLYYLHDSSGTIHYASTYPEHLANIKKYLK